MRSPIFTLLPIACAVALLAACGGSDTPVTGPDGQPVTPPPPVPWASPAMIVPPGAASKTIALSACTDGLLTATLVVNSSGDMILSGATNTTGPITELNRVNFDTATSRYVNGANDSAGPSAYVNMQNATAYIQANVYSSGGNFYSSKSSAPSHAFNCSLANGSASFALTTLPSSARLASQMLSGITGMTTTSVQSGTFTGGVAYWDNWPTAYTDQSGITDESIRYYSVNISTGAFGTSPTPNVAGTVYNITIPTTPTSTQAYFAESTNGADKRFYSNVATPSSGQVTIDISRVGNILQPYACADNYCD